MGYTIEFVPDNIKYDIPVTSYELCRELLKDTGVLFLPGETLEFDRYLRLGYCNNPEKLQKGLDIFSKYMFDSLFYFFI